MLLLLTLLSCTAKDPCSTLNCDSGTGGDTGSSTGGDTGSTTSGDAGSTTSGDAGSTTSGSLDGLVVFSSTRTGASDIYSMKPDGTELTRLTTSDDYEMDPALSPDGSRIAYVDHSQASIWLMDVDGGNQAELTDGGGSWNYQPAWSPDGTQIAFGNIATGTMALWVVNVDGSGLTQITDGSTYRGMPDWSPDGSGLLCGGLDYVYKVALDSTETLVGGTGVDSAPRWNADGTMIIFSSTSTGTAEIYSMNADGTDITQLTNDDGGATNPDWSPDGSMIIYTSWGGKNGGELYTAHADGSGAVDITNAPGDDDVPDWR
ncbi:MAG: hypothetical protein GXP62_19590 [Oligoflexia bacterium]|nr:hypothetical protein [Oligoflexia bacterium]